MQSTQCPNGVILLAGFAPEQLNCAHVNVVLYVYLYSPLNTVFGRSVWGRKRYNREEQREIAKSDRQKGELDIKKMRGHIMPTMK